MLYLNHPSKLLTQPSVYVRNTFGKITVSNFTQFSTSFPLMLTGVQSLADNTYQLGMLLRCQGVQCVEIKSEKLSIKT